MAAAALAAIVVLALAGGSFYMLGYSLDPDPNRADTDSAYAQLYSRMPDMRPWADSLRRCGLLRDTFVAMPGGERHHALWLRADSACGRTAVIVHGYKDCAVKFLYLGRMYHRDLGVQHTASRPACPRAERRREHRHGVERQARRDALG